MKRGSLRLGPSCRQFFANGRGRVADLVHCALQLVPRNAECLQPILDLETLDHVDLAAIGLIFLGQVVHFHLPDCEGNVIELGQFLERPLTVSQRTDVGTRPQAAVTSSGTGLNPTRFNNLDAGNKWY